MTTVPTTGPHQIQRLLPRHFKMLEMKLAGCSNLEIASTLDCTKDSVYIVSRSPLFIAEFNRQMKDQIDHGIQFEREAFVGKARSILEVSSQQAAETQVDLLESDDDAIRLRASGSILDRALGKTGSGTSDPVVPSVVINAQDANLLIIALKESTHAEEDNPATNGSTASPAQGKPRDVHKTPRCSSWFGHREAQTQDLGEALILGGVG